MSFLSDVFIVWFAEGGVDGRINKCNMFLIEIMAQQGTFRGGIIIKEIIIS